MADKAAYQWFKLYAEARLDRKLARLTLAERGVWVNLLCYASEQDDRGAFDASDTFMLAVECAEGDEALLGATLEKLEQTRCIERHGERDGWSRFRTFNKRQESTHTKPSDSPERVAERVHKHRDQQRLAALQSDVTLVTPCNAPVTPCNATEEEEEGDAETEQEEEQDPSADVAGVVTPRARGRAATSITSHSNVPRDAVSLCEQIAKHTHLPQRPDMLEHLGAVIDSHLARGLSPGDIWRDVLNLTDPSREKHIKRPSVSQLSNWLAHTHPADDLAALAAVGASNGHHRPSRGEASNGHHVRRQRQPDLPDPTQNGKYAHLFTVSGDDDSDG